jgi:hypothetical protein
MLFHSSPFVCIILFLFMVQRVPVSQHLLITEASRSHSDTPQSVGLLWTSDQPGAKTSARQHKTIARDRQTWPGGIRTLNPSQQLQAHAFDRAGAGIGASYLISVTNTAVLRNTGRSKAIGKGTALQAVRSGDRIPVKARFSVPVQTGPGTYSASCTMVIESFSRG